MSFAFRTLVSAAVILGVVFAVAWLVKRYG